MQFTEIVTYVSGIASIISFLILILKPVREKVFGLGKIRDAQMCALRQDMLEIYYSCKDSKKVRQYKFENFVKSYAAYKAMGGNSFIDKIWEEVKEWEVIT